MKLAITGGAGFIGTNFVTWIARERPAWQLVVIDKLTYAGNLANLEPVLQKPNVRFVRQDVCDPAVAETLRDCSAVVHLAAETHVDRSLEDASAFQRTNVEGTRNLLEVARHASIERFLFVSTDEVYGSLGEAGKFSESSPLRPTSPYATSKAEADQIALGYARAFGLPVVVARCSNNYGPFQFPEKFIPLMIAQALAGEPLPVYGDGQNVRDWLHVDDNCGALLALLEHGRNGEAYNVGAENEQRNLDVARAILRHLGRSEDLIQFVADRPNHDRRYALDCTRLRRELGWQPRWQFAEGLAATIEWYRRNGDWLQNARSGAYRDYFDRHYTRRDESLRAMTRS